MVDDLAHDGAAMTAYRRTPQRLVLAALPTAMALVILYDGWIADNQGDAYTGLGRQLISLPLLLVMIVGAVRIFRMGIWTSDEGVVVRNVLRSHCFSWSSVVSIRPPPVWGGSPPRRSGLLFVLSNGRQVSATLYSPSVFDRPGWGDALAADLWEQRERAA